MLRFFVVGFAVLVAVGTALPGSALADDVSTQPWATAPDATLAPLVSSPYMPQQWGGDSSSTNIFDLADPSNPNDSAYNYAQAEAMAAALEEAGEFAGGYVNPWKYIRYMVVTTAGTYIGYKENGMWFEWLDSNWGPIASSSDVCNGAGPRGSSCELVPVHSGGSYCIGMSSSGYPISWTPSSDGLLLETTVQSYWSKSLSGGCSTGYNAVALKSTDATRIANVEDEYNVDFELNSGQGTPNLIIWYEAAPGLESTAHTPPPSDPQPTTIEQYVGGSVQPNPNGDLTQYTITPTAAQWANGLRQVLTLPGDLCNGATCAWGDNGGRPGATQTYNNRGIVKCLLTGTCQSNTLICGYGHATVYFVYDAQHMQANAIQSSVSPDGCWRWQDLRQAPYTTWTVCSVPGYPTVTQSGTGSLTAYDDTNANHSDETDTMASSACLGSHSTLNLEVEADSNCSSAGDWVPRYPPGITVVNFLEEVYCSPATTPDEVSLVDEASYGASVGAIGNIGADIPSATDNGPCSAGYSTCFTAMTNDVEDICSRSTSILGLYSDEEQKGLADVVAAINYALNECYH
jgi:hypothetical protein